MIALFPGSEARYQWQSFVPGGFMFRTIVASLGLALVLVSGSQALAETAIRFATPGAPDELRDDLRSSSLLSVAARDKITDPEELLASAQADYARLLGVLYTHARYCAVINIIVDGREAAAIPPLDPPGRIDLIEVRVDPGPVYRFSEARIAPIARGTKLPEGFRSNRPARTDVIANAAETAITGWRDQGHAKARIKDQNIVARHRDARIAARLAVDPGPRLTFGDVAVSGNERVRTQRILTIAGVPQGQVFEPREVERSVTRLRRTGSFRSVTIEEAEAVGPGDTLPLAIGVVEQTPRRFGFGAEYSTVEGVRLSGFWLHRNLLGGAERFRVEGEVAGLGGETGGVDYSLGARFERPATPRADVDFFAELQFEKLDEPDFDSQSFETTLGFTRYATDDLIVDFGLGYQYSDVTDDFGRDTYSLVTLPLGAVYDRRRNPLNPKDGYFVDLEVTPFMALSGSSDGAQIKLDARGYESFGPEENLTFAARVQLGSLFGPALLESPPTYRFFSGGGGTVRGQDYQSLAITDPAGGRSGGRSFLGLSAEVRQSLTENIEAVAFADWGYIGSEEFPDFSGNSHAGAGLGLRYHTGVGPIRLDLATPVSGSTPASSYYIYIGIGQAF